MIQASRWVVIGQRFDRVQQRLGDPLNPARWRWALPLALAVLALVPPSAQSKAPAMPKAARQVPGDPPETDPTKPALPPRALLRIGTNDLRTHSSIAAVAFSRDGRLIAAAEMNTAVPRVSLFDVSAGRLVKLISPPDRPRGWVKCVAFSPDQTKLAWGEIGGEIALWDLAHDRLLFRENLHKNGVSDLTFSPDGQLVASGGADGAVRLRRAADPREIVQDLATGERQAVRQGYTGRPPNPLPVGPFHLAFTPDGTSLIVGSDSSATIAIWRLKDGQVVRRIESAHGDSRAVNPSLNFVAVTPDGRRIMSVGQTTKLIGETKLKYGPKNVTMSEVRFWDIETGQRVADYHGDEEYGFGYGALSRDGRHVAVGDFSRLRILDAATGHAAQTIELPGYWGQRPVFSPDGTLVAMPIHNTIGLFDVSTGRRLHHDESTPAGFVQSAAWSPAGDRLVTGQEDGLVRVWDAATGKLIWHKLLAPVISRSGGSADPAFVSFSRDGKLVVVAGRRDDPVKFDDGIVAIYESARGRTVREAYQKQIRWAALAPDARMVVVATSHGAYGDTHFIGVEVATGQTRWANPSQDERSGFYPVAGMHFAANSPWFQAALRDGTVIRFSGLTGHEQRRFEADWRTPEQQKANRPRSPDMLEAAFSADGRTLVSSQTEWIYVWDVESGTLRRKFRHPHQNGCKLTLSADGRTLATSDPWYSEVRGEDATRLYDIETGETVLTLATPDDRTNVLTFSPDGTKLFSGFRRGNAIVWDVRRGQGTPRAKE
jgi:WD40 repeat protein